MNKYFFMILSVVFLCTFGYAHDSVHSTESELLLATDDLSVENAEIDSIAPNSLMHTTKHKYYTRVAQSSENPLAKKKPPPEEIYRSKEWVEQSYLELLEARKKWRRLRKKAPDAFDYEKKLKKIETQIKQLEKRLYTPSRPARLPDSMQADSPATVVTPDTKPDQTGDTETFWGVFFQEEGIVAAELPAESELNVSGRQFIESNLSVTEFPNDPEEESESDFSLDQQLQVKVQGSIADDLLEIDINFNGSLPQVEQQSTKVKYNGRKRDVGFAEFQAGAKFGDVNLSLPGSKFVSFDKQVFGLSGQAHLRDFETPGGWGPDSISFYGVTSEKKGRTQQKTFTGKKRRRVPDPIPDIQPIRRTYYQPLADSAPGNRSLPIEVNSEQVLLDDKNADNNDDNTLEDKVVTNKGDTYTGDFEVLESGDDYSIDLQTGVIRFKQNIANNHVIAVSLTLNDGTQIDDFMIKDENESDSFERYHLENRYQLASREIVRNDPDRVLEVRDPNDDESPSGSSESYAELLGMDQNGDGVIDDEFIDFELGVLRFPDTQPFSNSALENNDAETNPTIYGPPAEREQFYEIYQEVLVEQNTFTLGINVVRNSEKVTVDGERMRRGQDYTIDYQTGFVSFFDHVEIDEETKINITFESRGAGAQQDETFLGGRLESKISRNLSIGSTILSAEEDELAQVPRLGEQTQSTLVSEFDVTWNPLHSMQDFIGVWGDSYWRNHPLDDHVTLDLKFDWASSELTPNQAGLALVESFDQSGQRVPFSKNKLDWSPGDPVQQFPGSASVLDFRSDIDFDKVENTGHDPDSDNDDDQRSMRVKLDMGTSSNPDTWASFQQLFASNGRDIRGFEYVEIWVKWEDNADGGTLALDLGKVTENTDRGSLKTEDDNDNDVLNPGEDDGYITNDFTFGENNGQLDSEDLNGNGRLDETEGYIHFGEINDTSAVTSDTTSKDWTRYRIPLESFGEVRGNANREGRDVADTPTRSQVLQNAQMVRFVYQSPPGNSGTDQSFLLEQMGVVRTRWNTPSDSESFELDLPSEAEDARIPPPGTDKFSSGDNVIEKALKFDFSDVNEADSGITSARLDAPGGNRLNQFKNLSIFFNTERFDNATMPPDDDAGTIAVQFGSDEDDFFQYSFPLDNPASDTAVSSVMGTPGNWFKLNINLQQFEQDLIDKTLNFSNTPLRRGNRLIVGNPSLQKVKFYRLQYIAPSASTVSNVSGEILWDAFHLNGVLNEEGDANEVSADLNIRQGLLKLQYTDREVDGEFRSIGVVNNSIANDFVAQNEITEQVSGSVDIDRYIPDDWSIGIPFSFSISDRVTEIPADRIERVRNENLGRVERENRNWQTGLSTPSAFPDFNFNMEDFERNVNQEKRQKEWRDDEEQWNLNANYSTQLKYLFWVVPVGNKLDFSTGGSWRKLEERRLTFGQVDVDTRLRNETDRSFNVNLGYKPADWLNTNLRYNFSDVNRKTFNIDGKIQRSQDYSFSLSPSQFFGFKPSYNLSTSINENFDRTGSLTKSVGLNGNSSIQINTRPKKWWEALDVLSLNYRFNIQSSGQYNNLESSPGLSSVYWDFFDNASWILSGPNLAVGSDSLSLARNRGSSNISHSLGGNINIWKSVSTRYNLNLSQNEGQTENSVNQTDATSFSLSNRFQLRQMFESLQGVTQSTVLSFDYSFSSKEAQNRDEFTQSPSLSWNTRWNQRWSTNFNLSTNFSDVQDDEVAQKSSNYNPSLGFKWLVNKKSDPGGLLWFENRLEINGNLSASFSEETRDGETRQDDQQYSGNFGGAYNLTERIKTRFSGDFTIFRDNFQAANDRNTYGLTASMDFRF